MLIILQWWFSDILFFLSFTKNQAVTSSGVYYMYLCLESCLWIIVLLVLQWQWLQYKSINEAVKDLCRSLAQSLTQSIYNKIQLLRATSNQILSICKSGDSTASLDNPCQWLTTLMVKKNTTIVVINPYIWLEFSAFQLVFVPCCFTVELWEEYGSSFSGQAVAYSNDISFPCVFAELRRPNYCSLSWYVLCSRHSVAWRFLLDSLLDLIQIRASVCWNLWDSLSHFFNWLKSLWMAQPSGVLATPSILAASANLLMSSLCPIIWISDEDDKWQYQPQE